MAANRSGPAWTAKKYLLKASAFRAVDTHSSASEVKLSASMMAKEIHRIQPVAPSCQSPISPGAQPFDRARGPRIPYPADCRIPERSAWSLLAIGVIAAHCFR